LPQCIAAPATTLGAQASGAFRYPQAPLRPAPQVAVMPVMQLTTAVQGAAAPPLQLPGRMAADVVEAQSQADVGPYVKDTPRGQAVYLLIGCIKLAALHRMTSSLRRWRRRSARVSGASPSSAADAEGRGAARAERTLRTLLGLRALQSWLDGMERQGLRAALRGLGAHRRRAADAGGTRRGGAHEPAVLPRTMPPPPESLAAPQAAAGPVPTTAPAAGPPRSRHSPRRGAAAPPPPPEESRPGVGATALVAVPVAAPAPAPRLFAGQAAGGADGSAAAPAAAASSAAGAAAEGSMPTASRPVTYRPSATAEGPVAEPVGLAASDLRKTASPGLAEESLEYEEREYDETECPAPTGAGPRSRAMAMSSCKSLASRFRTAEVAKRATIAVTALGISKEAGRKTVARTFYKHAKVLHPDKGGDKEDFQVLNEAYMKMQRLSS